MGGHAVLETLRGRGEFQEPPSLYRGVVAGAVGPVVEGTMRSKVAAPSGFPTVSTEENLLWVTCPQYSTMQLLGPCGWNADHGVTLPVQGAACVVAVDSSQRPTVIWWEGEQSRPYAHKFIPGVESTSSTSFALLTTHDEVEVTVPTAGIVSVVYRAAWEAVTHTAEAALFVGSEQAAYNTMNAAAATLSAGAGFYTLSTGAAAGATYATALQTSSATTAAETAAWMAGPPVPLVIPTAGTYKLSVRFKTASGGEVHVKERKLWAKVEAF